MSAGLPSPDELVAALETAGFEYVHHGRGYTRYRWPEGPRGDRSVLVLTDDTAPEYPSMVAGLIGELDAVERCGQVAATALNLLRPTTAERG